MRPVYPSSAASRALALTRTQPLFCAATSQIAYLLSHLMSVVERLEPAWRRAFLRRTRLPDADFQGDVLAVISTSCFAEGALASVLMCCAQV